ncbi:radical SAM protein [[Clostridium] symbiosum]|jgi:DNA repair photolyase|uniref:radical SAM protein n=1 Tax=Lachnospiraceae TaxID=186803 RepID=UPI000E495B87|nr:MULTISPECIES: radical SAM protein [Lachnospiraceae]MCQ4755837.1 radical SAM protein [Enterocloster bolteae]RGY63839.1 radical SAM protein [[Clostridium] symbiosum]
MKYITRKTMIYKTDVEYGDYTLNHVQGCSHGCKYPCYAFMMAKRFGKIKTYEEWTEPALVVNAIEIIKKEIPKLKDKIEILHLCFTTDPFMCGYQEVCDMSYDILKLLNENGIKCSVLTKGLLPEKLSNLSKKNEYGITLVSLNENFRKEMEPQSADFERRIACLEDLHNKGFKTWVSIEPYPTPNIIEQDVHEILDKIKFTDKIIFGRLNYNKKVTEYKQHKDFYNKCASEVIEFCNQNNIDFHIKNGTITNV